MALAQAHSGLAERLDADVSKLKEATEQLSSSQRAVAKQLVSETGETRATVAQLRNWFDANQVRFGCSSAIMAVAGSRVPHCIAIQGGIEC